MRKQIFVGIIIFSCIPAHGMWKQLASKVKTPLSTVRQLAQRTKPYVTSKPVLFGSGLAVGAGTMLWQWRRYKQKQFSEAADLLLKNAQTTLMESNESLLDDYCQRNNLRQPHSHTKKRVCEIVDSLGYKRIRRVVSDPNLAGAGALYCNPCPMGHILAVNEKHFNALSSEEQEFTIAHEVGHAHLVDKNKVASGPEAEKAADLYAVTKLGTAKGGIKSFSREGYLAPILWTYDWLMHYVMIDDPSNTHPSHIERVAYLKEWQAQLENESNKEQSDHE